MSTQQQIALSFTTLAGEALAELVVDSSQSIASVARELAEKRPLPVGKVYRLVLGAELPSLGDAIGSIVPGEEATLVACVTSAGKISAGEYFTACLDSTGIRHYGKQHVDSTGTFQHSPPDFPAHEVRDIACGYRYAIALLTNGKLALWGSGDDGVCNVPDFGDLRVACIGHCLSLNRTGHAIVILEDGTIRCWGCNESGQCEVPPLPSGRRAVQVAGGSKHSIALFDDGSLQVWGAMAHGLPDFAELDAFNAFHFADRRVIAIDAAYDRNIALLDNGSVVCFGYASAQSDTEHLAKLMWPSSWPEPGQRSAAAVSAGCHNFVVLLDDGDVVSVGARAREMLDLTKLGGVRVVGVAAGEWHCALLLEDGRVVGWGDTHGAYEPL